MWTAIKLLLGSRKFIMAMLSLVAMIGARYGFEWDAEKLGLVVLPFVAVIAGISYEDGQAKSAGSGTVTTTTTEPLPKGAEATVTVVEPAPGGKS